jgi:PleD family two-component response regulator
VASNRALVNAQRLFQGGDVVLFSPGHTNGAAAAAAPQAGTRAAGAEAAPQEKPAGSRMRSSEQMASTPQILPCVLVVDDEAVNLKVTSIALKRGGFAVLTAKDGQEALDTVRERHGEIHLVLMDGHMPVRAHSWRARAARVQAGGLGQRAQRQRLSFH